MEEHRCLTMAEIQGVYDSTENWEIAYTSIHTENADVLRSKTPAFFFFHVKRKRTPHCSRSWRRHSKHVKL